MVFAYRAPVAGAPLPRPRPASLATPAAAARGA